MKEPLKHKKKQQKKTTNISLPLIENAESKL